MWKDLQAKEIVGKAKVIDKIELVNRFLESNVNDVSLTLGELESLLDDLKVKKQEKVPGVYCLYRDKTGEVLYIGESRNLKQRLKEQFIGVKDKKYGIQKYTRLFSSYLSKDEGVIEKAYNKLFEEGALAKLREYMKSYQIFLFHPGNRLRVLATTDHVEAYVLEQTLISFFKRPRKGKEGQCKYNDLWEMSG